MCLDLKRDPRLVCFNSPNKAISDDKLVLLSRQIKRIKHLLENSVFRGYKQKFIWFHTVVITNL